MNGIYIEQKVKGTVSPNICSRILIINVLLPILFIMPKTCFADKGGWHISTKPVTLTESGQRAIIGWGGETEILCLATDVSSSEKTTVIEFLPLPSEPNVTLGSKDTFEAVEKLLARRDVKFFIEMKSKGVGGGGLLEGAEPFRITFHQRLGAHDVTVVKVNRPDEFADWIQEKAKVLTGGQVSLPDSIRKLIAKYLNEYNCPYFVFDVIEVGPDPQSVEPIIYEFKSSEVFYPLEISSTFHGQTTIDLVLFSKYLVDQSPFQDRSFLISGFAKVDDVDMQEVLPRLKQLLGRTAYVQAFRYTGRINRLRGNITAGPNRKQIGFTYEQYRQYRTGERQAVYIGIIVGTAGGVLIAFISLWPMYFAAKRQRPRWWLRLLLGFLLGIPLGFALASLVVYITTPFLYENLFLVVIFDISSMGMGFIIFCFQLGLRRRWYIWCLVYAALAIPVSYIAQPVKFLDLFNHPLLDSWLKLGEMGPWFVMHMAVFVALFWIAKVLVWITGPRKRQRNSLSR